MRRLLETAVCLRDKLLLGLMCATIELLEALRDKGLMLAFSTKATLFPSCGRVHRPPQVASIALPQFS